MPSFDGFTINASAAPISESKREDIIAAMERFAVLLPDKAVKLISRINAGPAGYNAIQRAASAPERFSLTDQHTRFGVPVNMISAAYGWPPNLIVAIDQEGNAMKAWIVSE
jgi:hypothetical protein